ncbi:DUF308 domain-containing protein [Enterobacter hormaechei]|uniref:DUF308 domain-containing protein n=1 Tax=Enterobacter hormaechei TaxID=158836 RepID=UPI00069A58EC|nr:DUF308 domain-containing protein [Enterobacter hormaechei]
MLAIDLKSVGNVNVKQLKKHRKKLIFIAWLQTICGLLCLAFPIYSGIAISFLTGAIFLVFGIVTLIFLFNFRDIRIDKIGIFCIFIMGFIYISMGIGIFMRPILGINIISTLICFLFLLAGISRIMAVAKNNKIKNRFWCIVVGIIDLIIASLWIIANEATTYMLTTFFIGLEMIFSASIYYKLIIDFKKIKKHIQYDRN